MSNKEKKQCICLKCEYVWTPRKKHNLPVACPDCKTRKQIEYAKPITYATFPEDRLTSPEIHESKQLADGFREMTRDSDEDMGDTIHSGFQIIDLEEV